MLTRLFSAVKFTSQGGIVLRVEQDERDDDCLMPFQLEDTGTGIDRETLPHLFKPFHQGNVTIARRFVGSGLGLSIAKTVSHVIVCDNVGVLMRALDGTAD